MELRNGSLAGVGARSAFRTLWCSAAAAIWIVDAASKAEPRIVKIVLRILNLLFSGRLVARQMALYQRLVALDGDGHGDSYDLAHHEAASKFIGQKFFGPNIRQVNRHIRFRETKSVSYTHLTLPTKRIV